MSGLPPQAYDAVRRHWADTTGYVVARTGDCLNVQTQETWGPRTRVSGRRFKPLRPAQLPALALPKSWFMGIILCPGDPLEELIAWARTLPASDVERLILYVHPAYDESGARTQWAAAGLRDPKTIRFDGSWENFHHLYGRHHAWRVYLDHPP